MSVKTERSSSNQKTAGWKPTQILQMTGETVAGELPAEHQIITEAWNRVVAVPYIVYMPERDKLLMLVTCDYPHRPMVMSSNDHGASWSEPKSMLPDDPSDERHRIGVSLTYLGRGRVLAAVEGRYRCSSTDYGNTWSDPLPVSPASDGGQWCQWDPYLVDKDPVTGDVIRVAETGYTDTSEAQGGFRSQGFIRFSYDCGLTWSDGIMVPHWGGVDEVALCRSSNGTIIAACRTNPPEQYKNEIDHYEGLGVSLSMDDGYTWTEVRILYAYGRHHPCMVLLPGGGIVMTYVVRLGYPRDENGFPQFGIEAIVSHDHGESWDLPHRLILARWSGNRKGCENEWWPSSQATSTVLLPDAFLLTAFGTGYRSQPNAQGMSAPRDVGLVRWRLGLV